LPSAGEMVSGPSVVFDSVFYFATFVPPTASGKTCSVGEAWLWGVDYETPTDSSFSATPTQPVTPPSNGGIPEIVVGSGSNAQVKQSVDTGQTTVMPGVAVTSTAACATTTSIPDPYMGGNRADLQNLQPAQYSVQ